MSTNPESKRAPVLTAVSSTGSRGWPGGGQIKACPRAMLWALIIPAKNMISAKTKSSMPSTALGISGGRGLVTTRSDVEAARETMVWGTSVAFCAQWWAPPCPPAWPPPAGSWFVAALGFDQWVPSQRITSGAVPAKKSSMKTRAVVSR